MSSLSATPPSSSFGFAARKERTAISQQPCRQLAKVLCVRFPPLSQASLLHRPLLPLFPGSHSLPGGEGAQLDCARIRRRFRTADYTLQEVFPTNYDPSSSSSLGTFFLFFFKAEFIEGKADKKMAKGAKKMTIMCPASDAHIGRGEGGARPSLHTHHHNLASVTSSLARLLLTRPLFSLCHKFLCVCVCVPACLCDIVAKSSSPSSFPANWSRGRKKKLQIHTHMKRRWGTHPKTNIHFPLPPLPLVCAPNLSQQLPRHLRR